MTFALQRFNFLRLNSDRVEVIRAVLVKISHEYSGRNGARAGGIGNILKPCFEKFTAIVSSCLLNVHTRRLVSQ